MYVIVSTIPHLYPFLKELDCGCKDLTREFCQALKFESADEALDYCKSHGNGRTYYNMIESGELEIVNGYKYMIKDIIE